MGLKGIAPLKPLYEQLRQADLGVVGAMDGSGRKFRDPDAFVQIVVVVRPGR